MITVMRGHLFDVDIVQVGGRGRRVMCIRLGPLGPMLVEDGYNTFWSKENWKLNFHRSLPAIRRYLDRDETGPFSVICVRPGPSSYFRDLCHAGSIILCW